MKTFRKPHVPAKLRELVLDLDARLEGGDALTDIWLPHEEWTRLVEAAQEEREKALEEKFAPCAICGEDDGHVAADCALADQVATRSEGAGELDMEPEDFEPIPPPLKGTLKPSMVETADKVDAEDAAYKAKKAAKKKPGRPTKKFPGGGTDLAEKCTKCGAELGEHAGTKCPPSQIDLAKAVGSNA